MSPSRSARSRCPRRFGLLVALLPVVMAAAARAQEAAPPGWAYSADQLRPFWRGEVMEGESILFVRDEPTREARASVLFPIRRVLAVRSSSGAVTYEEGRDYTWEAGSRAIVVPPGSRIATATPESLRRPANSQPFRLAHRDGGEDIRFGAKLEYHDLQTVVTYEHAPGLWAAPVPRFDPAALPTALRKLRDREPLKVVVLGDSISTGCNASGWAGGPPFQPGYPDLVARRLRAQYGGPVEVANLAVGGKDSAWGLTMVDAVVAAEPDLVLLAFGMNDAAGRAAADFGRNIAATMAGIRARRPAAEFILVAPMLGNPDWVALRPELFPQYRDALAGLAGPGVALADLTATWAEFLRLKRDRDQTGNGVNHPNDFGHRVYAQVIAALLLPDEPAREP